MFNMFIIQVEAKRFGFFLYLNICYTDLTEFAETEQFFNLFKTVNFTYMG